MHNSDIILEEPFAITESYKAEWFEVVLASL